MTIAASSGSGFFLIIIIAFAVLYLIVVRPQRRRQSVQQRMLSELRVGDDVLTAGGIYGRITRLDDSEVSVEIAPQTEVRVARRAIASILNEAEVAEPQQADEPEETESDGEKWQSAFKDDDSGGDKPG